MCQLSRSRCNELAALPELFVHHWEELTGIGICKGGSYIVSQSGVYPEQYSDDDLRLLSPEERRLLLEGATRPPLRFPCTPSQLLEFVDGGLQGEFEVPDELRMAVELPALLPQKDSEQSVSPGAPESAEPPFAKQEIRTAVELPALLPQKDSEQSVSSRAPESAEPPFTKQEILAVKWPIPPGAPTLEDILNERPKWVSSACIPVGKPGGGASGSHLWKPAMLALCLATTTPHKRWRCNKTALTNFLRHNFSNNFAQWEGFAEHL